MELTKDELEHIRMILEIRNDKINHYMEDSIRDNRISDNLGYWLDEQKINENLMDKLERMIEND